MNKEKTAMQMLIEEMQKDYDSIDDKLNFALHVKKSEIWLRMQRAKGLLQKEQEQIEKAFHAGYMDGIGEDVGLDKYKDANGKDYYQSKYGGEDD